MKKTVRVLGMACTLGLFALLGSSCNKETKEVSNINVNMPALEESFIESERAYIDFSDGKKMKWSEGDQLMVYCLNEDFHESIAEVFTLRSGAGTTVGHFYSDNAEGVDMKAELGVFAFYPAAKVEGSLGLGNSQTFNVPATQNYNLNTCDPTALVMAYTGRGILSNDNFSMQHIFGLANFRMKGTKEVASVKVIDNFFNLNGTITADLPGVDPEVLSGLITHCANPNYSFETYMGELRSYLRDINYTSNPIDNTMTLQCPGVQLNTSSYTNFIVTLRPGALAKGFVLEITCTDGSVYTINTFNPNDNAFCGGPNNPSFARQFCVKPGVLTNYNITGIQ